MADRLQDFIELRRIYKSMDAALRERSTKPDGTDEFIATGSLDGIHEQLAMLLLFNLGPTMTRSIMEELSEFGTLIDMIAGGD